MVDNEPFPCPVCFGAGEITEDHMERILLGRLIRDQRINHQLSVAMMAEVAGMSTKEIRAIESGSLPDTDTIEYVLGLATGAEFIQ